jgi:hypothetical protein
MNKGQWFFVYSWNNTYEKAWEDEEVPLQATTEDQAIAETKLKWDEKVSEAKATWELQKQIQAHPNPSPFTDGPTNPRAIYKILLTDHLLTLDPVDSLNEDIVAIKLWWQNFYQKYFKLKLDFSKVIIPYYQFGFNWIVIIPMGLTIQQVLKVIKSRMGLYLSKDDLCDEDIVSNDRDAKNGHYAVRFRKVVEADEEMKNLSANQLKEKNISGITLLERLVMELAYFEESGGKHLDIDNWTLCSGSRDYYDNVPYVHWDSEDSKLRVYRYSTDRSGSYLRARVAVSC